MPSPTLPFLIVACLTFPAHATPKPIDFTRDVQPILTRSCLSCHGPEKQKSDYRLDQKASALTGGSIGKAIVPGDSAKSLLLQYVAATHPDIRMPPKGKLLPDDQVATLRAWIDQGASWPDSPRAPATTQATHWALLPLNRPTVPTIGNPQSAIGNPIDQFVQAKLAQHNLLPSPPADRRTLIRRVAYDLTGLPPSPAEVAAFETDPSPTAYEALVDRLLASPRFGERWARHWMDVVHYAETHGNDQDRPRPNAWPYRDYLIRAFNSDKPYGRFVEEQVAGDAIYPADPDAQVGPALLSVGPWDESSQMGIMDGTLDKQIARYLDRDDMITTVMSTFVSSTAHCARCHNHKFDPISQADYYALQAVFAGVDRVDRPFDADPATAAKRRALQTDLTSLNSNTFPTARLLGPEGQAATATWEKVHAARAVAWSPLDPSTFTSTGGAVLSKLPDGSILSGGPRPEKDTLTITAPSPLRRITAVKLEVLTDPSLPLNGPGRQDNGNLHLSEFNLTFSRDPKGSALATQPTKLAISIATADHDQDGWGVARAIDNNPATAWGIYPQVGKPHFAVFELKAPLDLPPDAHLTIALAQLHGGGHLIGRARLSVTDVAPPVRAKSYPDAIVAAAAVPADRRTEAQRIDLARHALKEAVASQLATLPKPQTVYSVAADFEPQGNFKPAKRPREVNLLRRGDIRQPEGLATPGAMSCVSQLPARFTLEEPGNESARRAALAKWLIAKENVLTWRSIANRVWQYHFGRGLCDTPNDFGKMGAQPTHPELLDYLATTLRDDPNQSLKNLHRLIVTSQTYRQSSSPRSAIRNSQSAISIDSDNHLLWHMNRTRLDAEATRDSILAISGKLDLTMGGPSVKQFIESPGVHVTPNVDYAKYDPDAPGSYRRAVYRFVFRTLPDPFMQTLDCPDASQLAPKRESSVTALQALAMLNDRFVIRQSEHVAARLTGEHPGDLPDQLQALYALSLCRPATAEEITLLSAYAQKHGLPNAVRMLLNSNEFSFIE